MNGETVELIRYTKARQRTWLGWLVLALLTTQALGQAVGIVRGRLVAFLGAGLAHDLRTQLYQHIQPLSLRFFDKRQTGAVMTRLNQDTQELQGTLMDGAQFRSRIATARRSASEVSRSRAAIGRGSRSGLSHARAIRLNPLS